MVSQEKSQNTTCPPQEIVSQTYDERDHQRGDFGSPPISAIGADNNASQELLSQNLTFFKQEPEEETPLF